MKIKLLISTLLCFSLQAMESNQVQAKEVKTVFARTPLVLHFSHIYAQGIATHILQDKALKLVKGCPLALELPADKEHAITAAFTSLAQKMPEGLVRKIALMLAFHILFSKEISSEKSSLLSLVIPYLTLSQQTMFDHIRITILSTLSVEHPDTLLPIALTQHTTTLLHLAVTIKDKEVLQALLSFNCTVDIQDSRGYTPLHYTQGEHETLKLLLEHGANCTIANGTGTYPIEDAFNREDFAGIKLLLQKSVLTKNKDLLSKIAYRASFIPEPEIPSLIERMFKDNGVYEELPFSLKVYLAIAAHNPYLFKLFDGSYHEPDAFSVLPFGDTLLHLAVRSGNKQAVEYFLKNGFDTNKANEYGRTPLHDARALNNTEIIELLTQAIDV